MAPDREALEDLVTRLRRMQADVGRLQELIVKEIPRRAPSGQPQPPAGPEPREETASVSAPCPYCSRPRRWSGRHLPMHGGFECERCGEFLDFRPSLFSSRWIGTGYRN